MQETQEVPRRRGRPSKKQIAEREGRTVEF